MFKLFKSYWFRLKRFPFFWVAIGIVAFVAIACVSIATTISYYAYTQTQRTGEVYTSSISLTYLSYQFLTPNSLVPILVLLVIAIFFLRDVQHGVYRNQLLSGFSRTQVYLGTILFSYFIFLTIFAAFLIPFYVVGACMPRNLLPISILDGQTSALSYLIILISDLALPVILDSVILMTQNRGASIGIFFGIYFLVSMIGLITTFSSVYGYYQLAEFFTNYQISKASSIVPNFDTAIKIELVDGVYQSSSVTGRTIPLILKTVFTKVFYMAAFGVVGGVVYNRRSLR